MTLISLYDTDGHVIFSYSLWRTKCHEYNPTNLELSRKILITKQDFNVNALIQFPHQNRMIENLSNVHGFQCIAVDFYTVN